MEAGRLLGPSQGPQSGVESLINRVAAFRQSSVASASPEAARFWVVNISALPVADLKYAALRACVAGAFYRVIHKQQRRLGVS